jgi:FtsP/CotA-like multicopper oxidase with cupredoxin domain
METKMTCRSDRLDIRRWTVAAFAALAWTGSVGAAEHVVTLYAGATTINLPDGAMVPAWGFGTAPDAITVPGPVIDVPAGSSLRIDLTNNLPVEISIVIPGQVPAAADLVPVRNGDGRITSFAPVTAAGGTRSYSWPSLKPGTFLYHSGTHPAVQVQMGLYGAVKRDAVAAVVPPDPVAPAQVYAGFEYDQDVVLLYSEIDPAFHEKVAADVAGGLAPSATVDYAPKYFLINGKTFVSTDPVPGVPAGTTTLLRFLNAGLETHAPMLLGVRAAVLAEDGNPYPQPRDHVSLCLPAGKTLDALVEPTAPGKVSIVDRRQFLSSPGGATGGMLTQLQVTAP